MTLEETIERAQRAEKLLGDELFTDAFEGVREAIHEQIERAPIRDTEGAERLRLCLKLLRDVRANIEAHVRDGKLAAFQIEQERKLTLLDFKR